MYTGIPVDNWELYSLKWLKLSKALERCMEAINTELPLAIKWLIVVFRPNKASAHPYLFEAKLQMICYKKILTILSITPSKSLGITGTTVIALSLCI